MTVTLYQVGGSVRDELLGLKSKDIDFAVECESFVALLDWLAEEEFDIFLVQPEFLTARARFPRGFTFAGQSFAGVTADFVVCRKEAHYTDARHPDSVTIGTIDDDLARRDFTMNAIAKRADGTLYDPHWGAADIQKRTIRAVGKTEDRLLEDPLRVLRALRFAVTKNFELSDILANTIEMPYIVDRLSDSVSEERTREELFRMLKYDTYETMRLLMVRFPLIGKRVLRDTDIWLKPTLEDR